jgi:hypothetical protein
MDSVRLPKKEIAFKPKRRSQGRSAKKTGRILRLEQALVPTPQGKDDDEVIYFHSDVTQHDENNARIMPTCKFKI